MGASFAYWRDVWKREPFSVSGLAEDTAFMADHAKIGTPVSDSNDPSLVVYLRHAVNSSRLTRYEWNDAATFEAREILGSDVAFYDELGELLEPYEWNKPGGSKGRAIGTPLQQLYMRHFR
jgi:hypothetical protein